jgi:HD-GYP domain-containing protein (c-di-GMP phosphodiesterase class II)
MDHDNVGALLRVVEMKDQSTAAHTWRVTLYMQAMSEASGLSPDEVRRMMHAAVLHDIGKIDIPHQILSKPGPLTDEEYEIIKSHTVRGHERLIQMGERDPLVLALVRWHHERLDGSGYPDGLRGEAIPPVARLFAVIDTFDALTSLRPYRREVGHEAAERAIAIMKTKAGAWYCPDAVRLLDELYQAGRIDFILHHLNDEASIAELPEVPELSRLDRIDVEIEIARDVTRALSRRTNPTVD